MRSTRGLGGGEFFSGLGVRGKVSHHIFNNTMQLSVMPCSFSVATSMKC